MESIVEELSTEKPKINFFLAFVLYGLALVVYVISIIYTIYYSNNKVNDTEEPLTVVTNSNVSESNNN